MQILFVCTGNYYRSRFAELLFNHLATGQHLLVRAFSRGLQVGKSHNPGKLSPHTLSYLSGKGISLIEPLAEPMPLSEQDLQQATLVIVLDETEHRPMLQAYFPHWEDKVTYWQFEDDYLRSPQHVLPALERQVIELVTFLSR